MSVFGENYQKNDLYDNIQIFFKDGGTIEEMFDVLKVIFEYGETPVDELKQQNQKYKEVINKAFEKLEKENQELKKQLGDCKNRCKNHLNNQLSEDIEPDPEDFYLAEIEGKANDYDKLVAQQKEFIKYLEKKIRDMEEEMGNSITKPYKESHAIRKSVYQEILSKYKKIIGSDKECL